MVDNGWGLTDAGGKRRHKQRHATNATRGPDPTRKTENAWPEKFPGAFREAGCGFPTAQGSFLGGGGFWKGISFVLVFGVRRSEGGKRRWWWRISLTTSCVMFFFLEAHPNLYLTPPRFVQESGQPFKSRVLQNVFFAWNKHLEKKCQTPPQKITPKRLGHLCPQRLFFACAFLDKKNHLKFWKVARLGPRISVSVSRLGLKVRNPQISMGQVWKKQPNRVRYLGQPKELLKYGNLMLKQALPPGKLTWQWNTHHLSRCISYWKWGFSNVMLVFRGVYNSGLGIYYSNLLRFIEKNRGW